ncbi:MAG TPA: NAD(P)-dependent oxidoreductase [Crinalium sp.]
MKIGLMGIGLMGLPMAQRLISANVSVVAYNRTTAKLAPLQSQAECVSSPVDVLRDCDATILMLSNAQAIRAVLFNESTHPLLAGNTIIQMGTIAPSESKSIQQEVIAAGGEYLEAPVLGSIPEAKDGRLLVMVGASSEQYQRWLPVLQKFGEAPLRVGEVGAAAALKLALNQLIGSLAAAFGLSLSFLQTQGVEVETFMQILRQSALYAPTFDKKLQRMLEENYANPNFPTKHLLKDTNLFLQEAIATQLGVESLTGVQKILERACDRGLADADYSALYAAIKPPAPEPID